MTQPDRPAERLLVQAAMSEIQAELLAVLERHRQRHAATGFPGMGEYLVLYALTELLGDRMRALIADDPGAAARCEQMIQQLTFHIGAATTRPQ